MMCRKHYNEVWRRGYVLKPEEKRSRYNAADGQPVANLTLQWNRLMEMYQLMSNVEKRIILRIEIKEVEAAMVEAGIEIPKGEK